MGNIRCLHASHPFKGSGVAREDIVCQKIESCGNGEPPVRLPGKCCQQCGKQSLKLQAIKCNYNFKYQIIILCL